MKSFTSHWHLWVIWSALLVALIFLFDPERKENQYSTATLLLGGVEYQLEVADTERKRARGLAGRESLCSTCGMVFVFPEKTKSVFWMKNMRFDLDFLWLSDGEVVQKNEGVSFQSRNLLEAREPVDTVIELPSGATKDIEVGEKLDLLY